MGAATVEAAAGRPALRVVRDPVPLHPVEDAALGPALLARAVAGGGPALLRLYSPRPTVAFSRRDTHAPGFADAARAARRHGFTPVVRAAGGRAAAYHEAALVLDHLSPDPDPHTGSRARFVDGATRLASALRTLGVDARVGAVPGEYCPGDFSVNDRGRTKVAGTAQRVVRGGWLFGAVVLVSDPDPVRAVLEDVYARLGLEWDPATVGAVSDSAPAVTVAAVEAAVLAAYSGSADLVEAPWPEDALRQARAELERYRPPGL
jgi:lipoate-protein ligase A